MDDRGQIWIIYCHQMIQMNQVFWDESNWSCLGRSSTAGDNTLLVVPSVKKPPFKAKNLKPLAISHSENHHFETGKYRYII